MGINKEDMIKVKYNKDLLDRIIIRDKCVINSVYHKLTRNVKIKYICTCGTEHEKLFRAIYEFGALCKDCINIQSKIKSQETCLVKYGHSNPMQCPEIREKTYVTNELKRGHRYTFDCPIIKEQIRQTNIKNIGYEYPFQSPEIRNDIKKIFLEKYQVECIGLSEITHEKRKQTCLDKYGTEYPLQNTDIINKTRETCLLNNGFEYPFQNSEIQEKNLDNMFNLKEYIFPDDTIIYIQGYENMALDILIKEGYTSDEIITGSKNVPNIYYFINDKKHRYYCDIYLPSLNKIIEVKSIWTYEREIEKNILKAKACVEQKYLFEFWLFNEKKKLQKIIY